VKEPLRIVDLVFTRRGPRARTRTTIAIASGLGLYAALGGWLMLSERPLGDWGAEVALRVHAELMREQTVELEPPRPPPPQPPPKEPEKVSLAKAVKAKAEKVRVSSAPPPPAQAGRIVAAEPNPTTPVDLTGNTFVTGTASTYAGGTTSAKGTSTAAVHSTLVDPKAKPHALGTDRASGVALRNPDWTCPWPEEAEAEEIDHQVAIVRVVVDVDGSVASASIVSDPGHGFGRAALDCARRERFIAAKDHDGHAIRAESPPIRVRFTR
jgi:protein TonB